MVEGKLEPTIDEDMKTVGHGTIHVVACNIVRGTTEDKKEPFSVDANPKYIIVTFNDREVLFSVEEMIEEALEKIEQAHIHDNIQKKIEEQAQKRDPDDRSLEGWSRIILGKDYKGEKKEVN